MQCQDVVSLTHDNSDAVVDPTADYVKAAFLAHDPMLEVKKSYADKMEKEAVRDLIREKRGILILDLDHTLFQVTLRSISKDFPSLQVWNVDTEMKHSGKLLEGKTYWFNLDSSPQGPPFFIHLRPGLYSFLTEVSKLFELYAYTQGTNEYARKILGMIDPSGDFFGAPLRLIAREIDPATGHATRKNLSRVFPNEEGLVLIIDDRDDVWDSNASWSNLIKLSPFLFFQDKEREKLFAITPTSDSAFHPFVRDDNAIQPSTVIDTQLEYLKRLLYDLHAEVFFGGKTPELEGEQNFSFPSVLIDRKSNLFSQCEFTKNSKVGNNVYKLIKQYGGTIVDRKSTSCSNGGGKILVNLGGLGQARRGDEPDLIHPWFVLFSICTLTVLTEKQMIEWFSMETIDREGFLNMWETVVDSTVTSNKDDGMDGAASGEDQDELDLLADIMN
jgi:FCP1-like phosphatase family protein